MALRRALAGLLAAPALVLAGCGGDSSVADPPVQSSPTSSPTSDPPAHETAEHFIRRWLAVGTRMQNTGKTAAYIAMTNNCRDCENVARKVRDAYAHGGYYKTRGVRSVSVHATESSSNDREFDVMVNFFPTTFQTASGANVQHFAGGPGHFQIGLARQSSGWQVSSFVQVAS